MDTWAEIRDACTLMEDEAILVLNKPAGWSVMGERHATDLVRLAREAGEELYPVHRIDKVTSGAVLFAKELARHGDLTRQFNQRSVRKAYLVVTGSRGLPEHGVIDLPLSTGRKGRVRVAAPRGCIAADRSGTRWSVPESEVFTHVRTYPSVTAFATVWEGAGQGEQRCLLVVRPVTGRRHQIRVHLAWIGHAIAGDPLFDRTSAARGARTCLHSWRLVFRAEWRGGERVEVEAVPGDDFWNGARPLLDQPPAALLDRARTALPQLDTLA